MRKTVVATVIITAVLLIGLTACEQLNIPTSEVIASAATLDNTKGEIYENKATGVGIVFPPEYIGKYSIAQADVGMFAVFHIASYELWKEKIPGSERGVLFTIEKWPLDQPEDIDAMGKKAISLFKTDEYAYFLERAEPKDCYTDDMENPATKEYLVLYADDMIKKIADSAYLLTGNNDKDDEMNQPTNQQKGSNVYIPFDSSNEYALQKVNEINDKIIDREAIQESYFYFIKDDELLENIEKYNTSTGILVEHFTGHAISMVCDICGLTDENGDDLYQTPRDYTKLPIEIHNLVDKITHYSLYENCAELIKADSSLEQIRVGELGGSYGMWPTWTHDQLYIEGNEDIKNEYLNYQELINTIMSQFEEYRKTQFSM